MLDKLSVFMNSETWEFVLLSYEKFVVGRGWIFVIKVDSNDTIVCLKAQLVVKGYI